MSRKSHFSPEISRLLQPTVGKLPKDSQRLIALLDRDSVWEPCTKEILRKTVLSAGLDKPHARRSPSGSCLEAPTEAGAACALGQERKLRPRGNERGYKRLTAVCRVLFFLCPRLLVSETKSFSLISGLGLWSEGFPVCSAGDREGAL